MVGILAKGALTVLAAGAGGLLGAVVAPEPTPVARIDGYEYRVSEADRPGLVEVVRLRAKRLSERDVHVRAAGEFLHVRGSELGYEVDVEAGVQSVLRKLDEARRASDSTIASWLFRRIDREPLVVEVNLPVRFEEPFARLAVEELAERVKEEPRDAALLIDEHKIVPARWGKRLSVEATLVRLAATEMADDLIVDAVVEHLRPHVTEADLVPVDITRVLATYETSFAGKAGARGTNIRVAAKYLDGAVILPGETLSFNSQVGRRVHGRGFVDAPVIINDELEKDVGGGVCQVATTLHGAAVFGNMVIARRRSHSRPSGYAPLGLDATVIDGKVDLRVRNPYDEPILVHTTFPTRYRIRVELLGREPDAKVEHAYSVTHSEPFGRRIWYKEKLAPGTFDKKQKGSPGMDVVSVLRIRHDDGEVERRTYSSKYYPVPEVFHAAPGISASTLPQMPEGAVGLFVDGEPVEGAGEPAGPGPKKVETDEDVTQPPVPTLDEADGLGRET